MMEKGFPERLLMTAPPHIHGPDTIPKIMWSVVLALTPALFASLVFFGWYAGLVILVCVASSVATEFIIQRFRHIPSTALDGSAVVTGILLAFTLPPNVPLYIPAIGGAFAIGIVKHAFGGLGCNIWNPALAARAFLLASYSGFIVMSKWPVLGIPFTGDIRGPDAITKATPCAVLKNTPLAILNNYSIKELFIGNIPGSIGETSALALLIGAAYLIYKGYINWRLPISYILAVAVFTFIFPVSDGFGGRIHFWDASFWVEPTEVFLRMLAQILSGGLILGAFFMATDMVTSPLTSKGQVIFGAGCGLLVALIRVYGGYPEGVCYSILIMNTLVWVIDKKTRPRFFGSLPRSSKYLRGLQK